MQYRSKGKSCGYYVRIIFFFSSLIQSLIIVSLVLFLIYGKTQASASSAGVQDLEESFSRLSIENVALRHQRKNLTNLLNTTLTEKARNDWDLVNLRGLANRSIAMFQFYDMQLQMKAGLELMKSNLTQTKQIMTMEKEQIAKERDNLILEAIRLRRDKSTLEKELELYRQKSKDQFSQLLGPISSVSKALLEKIDSLFPKHLAFQLTCAKQKEHLEQIQTNCTSLSREVENKLQRYLDIVGDQVSNMQIENNNLKAENWRLSEDYRWCSQNRTSMIEHHKRNREELQLKHDQEKEKLLMDKLKMSGEIEVLKNSVKYKNAEVDHLKEQINHLNMSCMARGKVRQEVCQGKHFLEVGIVELGLRLVERQTDWRVAQPQSNIPVDRVGAAKAEYLSPANSRETRQSLEQKPKLVLRKETESDPSGGPHHCPMIKLFSGPCWTLKVN
ncbi:hypothetical protein GOODEAATRI_017072 [Goodea atripinnis]|uniref:Uncharacterized protein n=1 Tax=Goodea atripinnis TaxID=208336 RepID=A0ABV0MSR5_9TELE